ncbi:MAG: hypothetical protein P0S93_02475 [Candidatus Neptunochlamydia sp.]|nr:hypothetical protein [Candidatus Neptunochlamydia sp.]
MGRRRSYFTLIELFLSIGLIALIGSLILLRAKPMLDHYRMNHSYERLRREIVLSKHLAQTATTDVEFQIEQHRKGLICTRKTDEPLRLGRTINTLFVIPYLQLEGSKNAILLIRSSGWIENDPIININLGKQIKTIDARELLN